MDQQYGSRAPELNLHHWKCRDYSWWYGFDDTMLATFEESMGELL
jgi:hypothetical protein